MLRIRILKLRIEMRFAKNLYGQGIEIESCRGQREYVVRENTTTVMLRIRILKLRIEMQRTSDKERNLRGQREYWTRNKENRIMSWSVVVREYYDGNA
ncbi:hypothetical protein CDAR_439971 [Caerostris darwini]|uniref:Uncharacterized protein n=1 Tax=Caerostris darwini TaxID=1538125 RepID=A0AAV4SH31_9ARAC|nr:hypothetical protein CDAR_439971 [Caerostris darwini]